MKAAEYQRRDAVLRHIYESVKEHTGKLHKDEAWENVYKVFDILGEQGCEVEITGVAKYETSKDGMAKWKNYPIKVVAGRHEFEGYLNAHAAGTVEDPFARYDINFVIW